MSRAPQALINVSSYPDDVEVPSFQRRAKCGGRGNKIDVRRPNWKEQPGMPDNWVERPVE